VTRGGISYFVVLLLLTEGKKDGVTWRQYFGAMDDMTRTGLGVEIWRWMDRNGLKKSHYGVTERPSSARSAGMEHAKIGRIMFICTGEGRDCERLSWSNGYLCE
jgi:hypothetical protein